MHTIKLKSILDMLNGLTNNGIFTVDSEQDLLLRTHREHKIKIICNTCGSHHTMSIMNFKANCGCIFCLRKSRITPVEEVKERIDKSGKFRLFTIPEPYLGKKSIISIECVDCRLITVGVAYNLYNNRCCKRCGIRKPIKRRFLPIEHYLNKTQKLDKTMLGVVDAEYIGRSTNCRWKCTICNHEWDCQIGEASRGHLCPSCKGKYISYLQTFTEDDIIERLKSHDVTIERYLEEYKGNRTRSLLNCDKCGYVWISKVDRVRDGFYCPNCCQDKLRYLYLQKLSIKGKPIAIKFGVSYDAQKRIYQQERCSIFDHELIDTFHFRDSNVFEIETSIKNNFNCRFVSEKDMPDGFTETIDYQDLEDLIEFIQNEL